MVTTRKYIERNKLDEAAEKRFCNAFKAGIDIRTLMKRFNISQYSAYNIIEKYKLKRYSNE